MQDLMATATRVAFRTIVRIPAGGLQRKDD